MISLSTTHGLNLDHVIEWYDAPNNTPPLVCVFFSAASEHETGQRQPHEARLYGQERATFLHWIRDQAAPLPTARDAANAFVTHAMLAQDHLQAMCDQWRIELEGVCLPEDCERYYGVAEELASLVRALATTAQPEVHA